MARSPKASAGGEIPTTGKHPDKAETIAATANAPRAPNSPPPPTPRPTFTALSAREHSFLERQYQALREEILKRAELQHQLLTLAILSSGALLAAGVQNKSAPLVLLYPTLAIFLAAAWTHHERRVTQIGNFIRENLEKYLEKSAGWETCYRAIKEKPGKLNFVAARGIFVITEALGAIVGIYLALLSSSINTLPFWQRFLNLDPLVYGLLAASLVSGAFTIYYTWHVVSTIDEQSEVAGKSENILDAQKEPVKPIEQNAS